MEKLVVMDYSDGTVNIYSNPPDKSTEELLKDYGHDIDRCSFMFWQGDVTVKVHE